MTLLTFGVTRQGLPGPFCFLPLTTQIPYLLLHASVFPIYKMGQTPSTQMLGCLKKKKKKKALNFLCGPLPLPTAITRPGRGRILDKVGLQRRCPLKGWQDLRTVESGHSVPTMLLLSQPGRCRRLC